MDNKTQGQPCDHHVAQFGSVITTQDNLHRVASEFYFKVADFNIRGGFDQVAHPGFLTEFSFCPKCGGRLESRINRDEMLLEAVENYDCKGRTGLERLKDKEIGILKKSMQVDPISNPGEINDSLRLYFVITREITFYKDHPNYKPFAICYTSNNGERVTVVGENAYDCIDKAMLQSHRDHHSSKSTA